MEDNMEYLHIKTLYIEVTHACNQHCKHCYLNGGINNQIAEMSTEQIKKIITDFKIQEGKSIILTGGEPIMRSDIFEILDYIETLKIPFNFASNSLAMTQKRLEKLASYKYLDMYFTSLLGVNKAKHKNIAEKDSYDKVLNALSFFEERKIPTYVQVTLANPYIDDIEEIAETLMQFANCTVKFTPIGTMGIKSQEDVKKNNILLVPKYIFEIFHSKICELQKKYPDRIEDCNIQNHEQIFNIIADYKDEKLYAMSYGFIAVRPNGDISFSCNMDNPYVFGKAYESLCIPIDKNLINYVTLLREAEEATLKEAENLIVEFDVTVDKYIRKLSESTP
jgi:MoaA/NifB/PqqE/SkfB family radical SAM enzyme